MIKMSNFAHLYVGIKDFLILFVRIRCRIHSKLLLGLKVQKEI